MNRFVLADYLTMPSSCHMLQVLPHKLGAPPLPPLLNRPATAPTALAPLAAAAVCGHP